MTERLRVCFMGTPEFAVSTLEKIVESHHQIVGVVTAVDKPAGRGRKLQASDVKKFALKNDLKVFQPKNLKSDEFMQQLKDMNPDVIVVVAFRMLPKAVWSYPKYGTFNLHASLLPKYRGAAPIHWAIINGETETGVTSFFIDEKIDTGHIILQDKIKISTKENVGDLYLKLMKKGADIVIETLQLIQVKGKNVKTIPQELKNDEINSSAPKLNKENTRINWNDKSEVIFNFVRGLNPFPLAWTCLINHDQKHNIKIYKADFRLDEHHNTPGTIYLEKKKLGVYTQDGILYIEELKMEGKRKMNAIDFLNGVQISDSAKLK